MLGHMKTHFVGPEEKYGCPHPQENPLRHRCNGVKSLDVGVWRVLRVFGGQYEILKVTMVLDES